MTAKAAVLDELGNLMHRLLTPPTHEVVSDEEGNSKLHLIETSEMEPSIAATDVTRYLERYSALYRPHVPRAFDAFGVELLPGARVAYASCPREGQMLCFGVVTKVVGFQQVRVVKGTMFEGQLYTRTVEDAIEGGRMIVLTPEQSSPLLEALRQYVLGEDQVETP